MKNTLIFYRDWYEALRELTPDERLNAYEAIMRYAFEDVEPEDKLIRLTTALMRATIDRDNDRYDETSKKRREAVTKRWQAYKSMVMNTKHTNRTDNDNDNVNDNVNDNEPTTKVAGDRNKEKTSKEVQKKDTDRRFVRPTKEQVEAYCNERGNGVDAGNFVDFYESKGWKVGSSPMKDWKAAVRTWEQRDGRSRKQAPKGVRLGVGEWIDEAGARRYGTGTHTVPMSAPPRPNESSYWSAENSQWVSGV